MTIAGWRRTAIFHGQLASLIDAGLPLGRALVLAGGAAGGAMAAAAARWSAGCETGRRLAPQLAAEREAPFIAALVKAGEESGRLPDCCRRIAAHYERLVRTRDQALGRLAYPVLLLHAALLAPAVPPVVLGQAPILALFTGPACLWGVIALGALAGWSTLRSGQLARLALRPPLVFLVRPLLVANTAAVLEAALAAGMRVQESFALAAGACGNRVLAHRLEAAGQDIAGCRLADVGDGLARAGFDVETVTLVRSGEAGGRLDHTLLLVAREAEERFALRLQWASRCVTGTIYLSAMLLAAYTIVSMYAQALGGAAAAAGGLDPYG